MKAYLEQPGVAKLMSYSFTFLLEGAAHASNIAVAAENSFSRFWK